MEDIDNEYISTIEHKDVYDRCVRCGKLVTGLIHSAERRK